MARKKAQGYILKKANSGFIELTWDDPDYKAKSHAIGRKIEECQLKFHHYANDTKYYTLV